MINSRGVSLVELLISLVIVGLSVMLGLEMYQHSNRQARAAELNLAFDGITRIARQKIRYSSTCTTSLGFTEPFSFTDTDGIDTRIVLEEDTGLALQQGALNVYGLNILSLKLINIAPVDLTGVPRKYAGLLQLKAEKTIDGPGGKGLQPRIVAGLMLETDAAGNYLRCYFEIPSSVTCSALGGVFNETANPQCQFPFNLTSCASANDYLVGFENGQPKCVSIDGACPADKFIVGVDQNGVICSP